MRKAQKDISEQTSDEVLSKKKHPGGRPMASDEDRVRIGQLIKKYRTAAKMDQADLARELGCCTGNAVGSWELGRNCPAIPVIPKLCRILNIPIHEIMGMEAPIPTLPQADEQLLNDFHSLPLDNQKLIRQLINQTLIDQERARRRYLRQTTGGKIRVDELSPAAGFGVPALDYVEAETVYMRRSWAFDHSDLITKVSGDSMDPLYPDGCLVFVNTEEETPLGEVGIFMVDDEYFIKERREDCLFSINRGRPDVHITENSDVRHKGRVMGRVDERDFFTGDELDEVRAAWETEEE